MGRKRRKGRRAEKIMGREKKKRGKGREVPHRFW